MLPHFAPMSVVMDDGCADSSSSQPLDWVSSDDLLARDVAAALVASLPVTHRGHDGVPCWRAEEIDDLIALAQRGSES